MKNLLKLFVLIGVFISISSSAAGISAAQIKQFQSMPRAQQEALARTMGVDIKDIEGQLSGMSGSSSTEAPATTPVYPRGTVFDESGSASVDATSQSGEDEFYEDEDQELQPFGYDIFANEPSTFQPIHAIAIPEGYIIGPGDVVSIELYGKESDSFELTVSREGKIVIPELGPYKVAGLSFDEMKRFLVKRIEERMLGVDAIVSVAEMRSMRIFILGDAYKPGPYTLTSLSSVTHAIFAAGGINDVGSLRNIQLKRAGKLVTTLDLYDLLIHGDSSNDVLLQSGDVVFVAPVGARVSVDGEVKRPAIYELAQGETFEDAINMAGGVLPSAYLQSTRVERFSVNNYRAVLDVDLTNQDELQQKAQAGDYIRVKKSTDLFEQSVTVVGAATLPGKYQWRAGKTVADLFPNIDSHLLKHADLNYSLVVRETDKSRNIEVLQFSLERAITNVNGPDNIELSPNDKVVIFSLATTLSEEKITLDSLAYTQEELFRLERKIAKEKHKAKQFWKKYGENLAQYDVNDENAERREMINNTIAQMSGGEVEEVVNVRELALFSRQRLLIPILKKLREQGNNGEPIQLVEIDGEVKFPGIYPLTKNARVQDLVVAAGGIKESAFLSRAEITRNQIEGIEARKTSKNIQLASALKGYADDNILLESKDRLNVHKIPSWSENHVVELRGEFVFPGKYTIRRGETLADIIKKAGGLTDYAFAEGSVFSRQKLKELEQENLLKLTKDLRLDIASKSLTDNRSSASYADLQKLLTDVTQLQPIGRLVLDLPKVIDDNDYDVLLENGDVLYVPVKSNAINVMGQVQVSSSHIFNKSMDVYDYINQSGGIRKRADDERIYVIAANGGIKLVDNSSWFTSDATSTLQPGDTVVVPLDSEYMSSITLWAESSQIVYQIAVAFAAISGI
ncbi:SLBB domain-containing protein [Thalassotalea sp. PLHSN55]|uniref:SLBB domain-containing protein n=1 Tax=Thalassotalea sp. PLHSN55 TaxID=3435888 RepID=UPI003F868531